MPTCQHCGRRFRWRRSPSGRWQPSENWGERHKCYVGSSTLEVKIEDGYCEKCLHPMKSFVNRVMCRCVDPKVIPKKKALPLLKNKVAREERRIKLLETRNKQLPKFNKCYLCGHDSVKLPDEYICLKDVTHRVPIK